VVDEYSAYSEIDNEKKSKIKMQEHKVLQRADLIVTVSNKLYESKRKFNNDTYLVPNAVDYEAYEKALVSGEPLPNDISSLPKPIIGYSGLIASKLDFILLKYMACVHSNWSITMVGLINDKFCHDEIKSLKQYNNIHFLGLKKIGEIPNYINAFDVCIAPYKINEHSKNMSPLKIYDYLATGKPVVTTNFAASRLFKEVIKIAKTHDEFLNHVKDSLSEEKNSLAIKRRNIASKNTWGQRVESLSKIIKSKI
jgi:glycosyltransferase involved in cell wall biosynthesis